jgi:predicted RNase H-like HicB family nuclease
MQEILNATEVRKNWSEFIDGVIHSKPSFVRRNHDYLAAMSLEHLQLILSTYRFSMEHEKEEDGTYSGSIEQIDVVENAETVDLLRQKLAEALVEYAQDYMDNFAMYYHSSNRRAHLPYILTVLAQPDVKGVERLIDA